MLVASALEERNNLQMKHQSEINSKIACLLMSIPHSSPLNDAPLLGHYQNNDGNADLLM